jgi:hypothetical protein
MSNVIANREAWLIKAVSLITPMFEELGYTVPPMRVAVGFGPGGARQENATILGVCLSAGCTTDMVNEVWISPEDVSALDDGTMLMMATLVHEMVHVVDNNQSDHSGDFKKMAKALGLEGKMTATVPGEDLRLKLKKIIAKIGEYPAGRVDLAGIVGRTPAGQKPKVSSGPKKQTARQLKVTCTEPECPAVGYTTRLSRKWLDDFGAPICPGTADHVLSEE